MAGLLDAPNIQRFVVPFVYLLILFLTLAPLYFFNLSADPDSDDYLSPGPLTEFEHRYVYAFSGLILFTYFRTCTTDPGRFDFGLSPSELSGEKQIDWSAIPAPPGTRWCRKCNAPKPPRAHHCKLCRRCIPRMDHHCPWTGNCVSLCTYPHFIRFLLAANVGLCVLFRLVWLRLTAVWALRDQPAYLGPSVFALGGLVAIAATNVLTELALAIILATNVRSWLLNETMIEGWQRDRHAAVLSKGPTWWPTSDGDKVRVQHVEFPYDIDFFTNLAEGMSCYNPALWFFPLMPTPKLGRRGRGLGWEYPENGFNQKIGMWPPPDPARKTHEGQWPAQDLGAGGETHDAAILRWSSVEEQKRVFRERQTMDRRRWAAPAGPESGRILGEVDSDADELKRYDYENTDNESDYELFDGPVPQWRNTDGETLKDFGVEEDSEDDIPLGELIRRRKQREQEQKSE
ncbi:hypothetical protein TD95_000661 [Thielaviopsis punctulata]|uniref:Palmitoyltransferase PFA4 n=1 Tax=Thielaviopsis punctulata TaxID=72032 RepID=A0A0F4ZIK9_9PEZI|nr:hypothetical protein TD95_000661 [Thielaviopsis punctulata]